MHYKDGTKACLGDIARGRGYNLPYEVQGVVVGLNEHQDQCGIHLAVPVPHVPLGTHRTQVMPLLTEEHGTCSEFELVHPSAADPLPRT